MEEQVYLCGLEKFKSGFKVWLKEEPFSEARAQTIGEALQNLIEAVIQDGGAVTPTFEFSPPLPHKEAERKFYEPEILVLTGDERFGTAEPQLKAFALSEAREAADRWFEQFFSGSSCRKCRMPGGQRNDRLLQIRHASDTYDGGFTSLGCASINIFSGEFLKLLSSAEREFLKILPIESDGRSLKEFFELVGPMGVPWLQQTVSKPAVGNVLFAVAAYSIILQRI